MAGKHDSRRHFTTSFSENVPFCGRKLLSVIGVNILRVGDSLLIFLVKKMYNKAFRGVCYLSKREKTLN